ncbi:MAG: PepSY-associated TM helix domain-containing protein [Verrucomicrobiota bacterium]
MSDNHGLNPADPVQLASRKVSWMRSRQPKRWSLRRLWIALHRWLGLTAGLVLAIIGLTGSLYVFYQEIAETLAPATLRVQPKAGGESAYRPWSELIAAAKAHCPTNAILSGILGPPHPAAAARVIFVSRATPARPEKAYELCIDPYTGAFLGENLLDRHLLWRVCSFLFELHYSLKLGNAGGVVVGILAIAGLISILSGLYLWWPRWKALRHALTIKRSAATVRQAFDLHRVIGFYSSIVLGAVLLSGIWMNLNSQFVSVVKLFSPGTRAGEEDLPKSSILGGKEPRPLTDYIDTLCRRFPEGRLNWLSLPDVPSGAVSLSFVGVPGVRVLRWSERTVWVDQFTGAVLRVDDPGSHQTAGETFLAWQWPLHSGKAFGWPGRIAVFVTGLALPLLYGTGLAVSWKKYKASTRANARRRNSPTASATCPG